jgi:hypothetical protein
VPLEQGLDRLGQVVRQMPAVGDLDRRWSAVRRAVGVLAGSIARNDLDAGMGFEPSGKGLGGTVREEIDRAMPLEVNQDGAVALPLAFGPVVDS